MYAVDDRFDFLKPGDVVTLKGTFDGKEVAPKIKINSIYKLTLKQYLDFNQMDAAIKIKISQQIGKLPAISKTITIAEFNHFHSYGNDED